MSNGPVTKPLEEYELDVLTGGNHLASLLTQFGIDLSDARHRIYDEFLNENGTLATDIWVAWKAIDRWNVARQRVTK